jgi:hypothetical protein
MQALTSQGKQKIEELAQRYGVSAGAVMTLLQALIQGQGRMAQFNHPELGGPGQWLQGGMVMVGDMFNHALKAKVDGLCAELSGLLAEQSLGPSRAQEQKGSQSLPGQAAVSLFVPSAGGSGHWWPAELGTPAATGMQNTIRYAYFPEAQRLAIEINGQVAVYDTLDHQIRGVSQQQGSGASLTFTSQHGLVSVSSLPVVSKQGVAPGKADKPTGSQPVVPEEDIFSKIERLAELRQKGVLSEEEFAAKKAELLGRL